MGSEAGKEVRVHISFVAYLIGRILVGLYYLYNALNHFKSLVMMAGYAGSKGVPAPKLAVAPLLLAVGGQEVREPGLQVAAQVPHQGGDGVPARRRHAPRQPFAVELPEGALAQALVAAVLALDGGDDGPHRRLRRCTARAAG